MKQLVLGLLVLCAFSLVSCQESSGGDRDRCRPPRPPHGGPGGGRPRGPPPRGGGGPGGRPSPPPRGGGGGGGPGGPPPPRGGGGPGRGPPPMFVAPPACLNFTKAVHEKAFEMMRNEEIGSCSEPKSCEECMFEDFLTARNQVQEPIPELCAQQMQMLLAPPAAPPAAPNA